MHGSIGNRFYPRPLFGASAGAFLDPGNPSLLDGLKPFAPKSSVGSDTIPVLRWRVRQNTCPVKRRDLSRRDGGETAANKKRTHSLLSPRIQNGQVYRETHSLSM